MIPRVAPGLCYHLYNKGTRTDVYWHMMSTTKLHFFCVDRFSSSYLPREEHKDTLVNLPDYPDDLYEMRPISLDQYMCLLGVLVDFPQPT